MSERAAEATSSGPQVIPTTRAGRARAWLSELTSISGGILAVGAASLIVVVLGSLIFLVTQGPSPYTEIVSSATSPFQSSLLYIAMGLAAVAIAGGYSTYRRMPTKPAREAAVSGAALGLQTVFVSAAYLVFREGEKFAIFVRQFFSFDVLGPFMGDFLNAMKNTLLLALTSQLLGMILGMALALLVLSNRVVVRAPARAYINLIRGTPLLVQLSVGYFGVVLGLGLDISVYTAGIAIFALNVGGYSAEIFRSGIQSLERGQLEAARSLGMSYIQAMRYVIVPQAIRRVIPPLTNEFVILIKDTSLIVFLGVAFDQRELLQWASDTYSDTFNSTPFIAAVVGYLVITLPMIRAVTALERRLRSGLVGIGA